MRLIILSAVLLIQTISSITPIPTNTAAIEGFVLRLDDGRPIEGAHLMLTQTAVSGSGAGSNQAAQQKTTATTDKLGHFKFSALEPGRYTLNAYGDGFVHLAHGQRSPSQPSTPIVLTGGQQVTDIVFRLSPTATVTGRIYDFDNVPLANADVNLLRISYDANGQKTLQIAQTVRTNDLGEYRLFWVTPGRYYLNTAIGEGGGGPISPNQFAGRGGEYPPTYVPGTIDPGAAKALDLPPGAVLNAMDIMMIPSGLFRIRGRLVDTTNGSTGRTSIDLAPVRREGVRTASGFSASLSSDGNFEIRNVPSGNYVVRASSRINESSFRIVATTRVDVRNYDVDGVVLMIQPRVRIPGRIYIEGNLPASATTPPPSGPAQTPSSNNVFSSFRLALRTREPGALRMDDYVLPGLEDTFKADGTFVMSSVNPGSYLISFTGGPVDSFVKSVRRNHTDVLQDGLVVESQSDDLLEVVVSTKAPRIDGTLVDKSGNPVSNTMVLLVPADRQKPERFKTTNSDPNGHFTIRGISPGVYKLFAWDALESGDYRDPDFIAAYEVLGKRIVLNEGDSQTVQIRLIEQR